MAIMKKKQSMLQLHSRYPSGGNLSDRLRWHRHPPERLLRLDQRCKVTG